jgi:RNA polymerase sigma-70 factor (ECF subfamily)
VLVRACYAEGRKTRRWAPNLHVLPDSAWAGPDGLASVWDRDQVERGFQRLSVEHRAVLVLHYYLDQTPEEIAETLGVPTGTVRSRLFYGMRGLRAALEADARPRAQEAAR